MNAFSHPVALPSISALFTNTVAALLFAQIPVLSYILSVSHRIKAKKLYLLFFNVCSITLTSAIIIQIVQANLILAMLIFGLLSIIRYRVRIGQESILILTLSAAAIAIATASSFYALSACYAIFIAFIIFIINTLVPASPAFKKEFNYLLVTFSLNAREAEWLAKQPLYYDYFYGVMQILPGALAQSAAVFINQIFFNIHQQHASDKSLLSVEELAWLIEHFHNKTLDDSNIRHVLRKAISSGKSMCDMVRERKLDQFLDRAELELIIDNLITANQNRLASISDNPRFQLNFMMGLVKKEAGFRANAKEAVAMISDKLKLSF